MKTHLLLVVVLLLFVLFVIIFIGCGYNRQNYAFYVDNDDVWNSSILVAATRNGKTDVFETEGSATTITRTDSTTKSVLVPVLSSRYSDTHQPFYYTEQLIDHTIRTESQRSTKLNDTTLVSNISSPIYYTQRYYQSDKYYDRSRPTNEVPIFVILGGEGSIPPSVGLMYPFIYETLAKKFGAYVVQPEHRFYGTSQPLDRSSIDQSHYSSQVDPRIGVLTYEQALDDAVRLLHNVSVDVLGCTVGQYTDMQPCGPVIAVGGSYPGFLSAMTRIIHPNVFDISYAASAPIYFYSQQTPSNEYYKHIASVSDTFFNGCSAAVYKTLQFVQHYYLKTYINNVPIDNEGLSLIGVCDVNSSFPSYATANAQTFIDEITMMTAYTFANANMAFYPPSSSTNNTALARACTIFMDTTNLAPFQQLSKFFIEFLGKGTVSTSTDATCFNMSEQVPYGPDGTISGGDWSGVGSGYDADSWDFQTCTQLIETISIAEPMFPIRNWTIDWLSNHCANRFNTVIPNPNYSNDKWQLNTTFCTKYNTTPASYILFTNGNNDGWSVSGVQQDLSDTVRSLNFPNGAHHSDLNRIGPNPVIDSDDITAGYKQIEAILSNWIAQVIETKKKKKENNNNKIMETLSNVKKG